VSRVVRRRKPAEKIMPDETVREMVERYKKLTADGDPHLKGERLLGKIIKTRDPAAIELLLILYPTQDGWNSDEMNEVASALENAPPKRFVPEFARLAAQVCRHTPRLFDALMGYVFGFHLDLFLKSLPPLSAEDRELMIGRNEQSRAGIASVSAGEEEPEEVKAKYEQLFTALRQ
jgi:hypothetical protein